MKQILFLLFCGIFASSFAGPPPGAQGIGVNPPKAMLEIKGEILLDSARTTPLRNGMIQYKNGEFYFRKGGAWTPLGDSSSSANITEGNGMTYRNDTINGGGKLKNTLAYYNSTDTLLSIDTLGNLRLNGVKELPEDGAEIDSSLVATRNSLNDSIAHWFFDDNTDLICFGDSTGTTEKIKYKDNIKLVVDTTNFGSCTGTQAMVLLMWKTKPYDVPSGYYVDTFGIFFGGYDTLNVSLAGDIANFWFASDGNKIFLDPYGGGPFSPLGNPFPTTSPEDTIGFLSRHFGEKKTHIDSLILGVVIPLYSPTEYTSIIDRIRIVYNLKPNIYKLGVVGDKVIKLPNTDITQQNYVAGNGIGIVDNNIKLGDITENTSINANAHDYNLYGANNYSMSGNTVQLSGNSMSDDGIRLLGYSSAAYGIEMNGNSSNPGVPGVEINAQNGYLRFTNLPTDNASDYVLGRHGDVASWIDKTTIGGGANIYNSDGSLNSERTLNTSNNRLRISSDINNPGEGTEFFMAQPGSNYKTGIKRKSSDFGIGIVESGTGRNGFMSIGTVPDEFGLTTNGNYNPNITITRIPNFAGSGHDFNSINLNAGGFGYDTTAALMISTNQNSAYTSMFAKTNIAMSSPFASQFVGFVMDTMFQISGPRTNDSTPRYVVTGSGNIGSGEILTFTNIDSIRNVFGNGFKKVDGVWQLPNNVVSDFLSDDVILNGNTNHTILLQGNGSTTKQYGISITGLVNNTAVSAGLDLAGDNDNNGPDVDIRTLNKKLKFTNLPNNNDCPQIMGRDSATGLTAWVDKTEYTMNLATIQYTDVNSSPAASQIYFNTANVPDGWYIDKIIVNNPSAWSSNISTALSKVELYNTINYSNLTMDNEIMDYWSTKASIIDYNSKVVSLVGSGTAQYNIGVANTYQLIFDFNLGAGQVNPQNYSSGITTFKAIVKKYN